MRYWYANATRFIPLTIHEFPGYSFVVSDNHGHVLSLPFVLLAIALVLYIYLRGLFSLRVSLWKKVPYLILYGVLLASLLMTNALDGPIYFGLFGFVLLCTNIKQILKDKWLIVEMMKVIGVVVGVFVLSSIPFLLSFDSFVNGVAVNCPFGFIADTQIGPLLFEGIDKCQRSPFWMMWLLWGFFWFNGIVLIIMNTTYKKARIQIVKQKLKISLPRIEHMFMNKKGVHVEKVLVLLFLFSVLLIIFPEFFYFKDIYPAHFRSNTMFKLGYQAYIIWTIMSAYVIMKMVWRTEQDKRQQSKAKNDASKINRFVYILLVVPQLFLVSIYPYFSVRSYFGGLKTYRGLDGMAWLEEKYPDDFAAIEWLNKEVENQAASSKNDKQYAIVEADGESYTDYNRVSVFTGVPTVVGWAVHEWLWRGSYDVVSPRREDVQKIYEDPDMDVTRQILSKYNIRYIIVGSQEYEKYPALQSWKFNQLGTVAFEQDTIKVWKVDKL